MNGHQPQAKNDKGVGSDRLILLLLILVSVLAVLFHRSFEKNSLLFFNDGQLGAMKAEWVQLPQGFGGQWSDVSWTGAGGAGISVDFSSLLSSIMSTEMWLKFYAPLTSLLLGFSVWLFLRQLRLNSYVCVLGGLAGALNMHAFSNACWGLGGWSVSWSAFFLSLAALFCPSIRQSWARMALSGLAIGISVIEGLDVGAIFSIYAGIFVVFVLLALGTETKKKVAGLVWKPALLVVFAFWIAIHSVSGLIGGQVKGIVGTGQTKEDKAARWDFCTQWSLPKLEAFRLIIPGVFGYQMPENIDGEDKSSAYWGRMGEDPRIQTIAKADSDDPEVRRAVAKELGLPEQYENALVNGDAQVRSQISAALKQSENRMTRRHTGSGEYAGILVAVLAVFGLANALRGNKSPLSVFERRLVYFWAITGFISLLLAFGRHGFLYQYFFQLPYVSTIRNTAKFLFPVHTALIIMAAFGLETLYRNYLKNPSTRNTGVVSHVKAWWKKAVGFEKKWVLGSVLGLGLIGMSCLVLLSSRGDIERYLQDHGFDPVTAPQIAGFFSGELLWFGLFLSLSVWLVLCIMSGAWNGPRAKWAWTFLILLMVVDMARADRYWVRHYDVRQRYMSNPVLDALKDKPYEHRVTAEIAPMTRQAISKEPNLFAAYYVMLQNQMPYWNIQSLDIIQMPRTPEFDDKYISAFKREQSPAASMRLWQLTNTRYVIGSKDNPFGLQLTPENGFIPRVSFQVGVKPGLEKAILVEDLTFVENPQGPNALFEYTNALPRVKLYSNWQTTTNDDAALSKLVSREFQPEKTVLVSSETPVSPAQSEQNADPGTVSFVSYHPKDIILNANAKTAAVLLLNDHYAADWKVFVDGKPASLLRCNYLMRGVALQPGEHKVEFHYRPDLKTFYLSLSAWGAGLLICGFVFVTNRSRKADSAQKTDEKSVS